MTTYPTDVIFLIFGTNPDVAILDSLLPATRKLARERPLIVVIPTASPSDLVNYFEQGASDVWIPPLKTLEVLGHATRWVGDMTSQEEEMNCRLKERLGLGQFIGESPQFMAVIHKIPVMAGCDLSILLRGETGTGKEICARAIHYLSPRHDRPFLPLNCAGFPTDLVENELFGHEAGAYTGANASAVGLVQRANGGTLFLDEVDSLSLPIQAKFLRFLQDKQYRKLGSQNVETADLRIITATNCDLNAAIRTGAFRQDLYYRLAALELPLPALRERGKDLELLAQHFLERHAAEWKKPLAGFTSAALRKLHTYRWPGNVRELENVIAHAVLFTRQSLIQPDDIHLPQQELKHDSFTFKELKGEAVKTFEKNYLSEVLRANGGNISKAAAVAGKNRRAFWQLLRKYELVGPAVGQAANGVVTQRSFPEHPQ